MPNRLLREGICTSELINMLSPDEEVMFYRLLVVCDDFGYADARPAILKAQCFPLKESVTSAHIERWLQALSGRGLVLRYRKDEKPYLAVGRWEQRVRSRQRFPGPTDDGCHAVDGHLSDKGPTSDRVGKGLGKGKGKGDTAPRLRRAMSPLPDAWKPAESSVADLSREFGLRAEDVDRYVDAFRDYCTSRAKHYADFDAAFRNCVRQDWPKIRTTAWTPAVVASSALERCQCGAAATMKVSGQPRCAAHARGLAEAA